MAIVAGVFAAAALTFAADYGAGNLHPLITPPFHGYAASSASAGPRVIGHPYAVTPVARTGTVARGYVEDFYERVHLIPPRLDLGNLLSSQVREVVVWSAYRAAAQLLSAVTGEGTDGLTLTEPQPAPTTFAPLEYRTYAVAISLNGPPTIDASYTFVFPAESPVLPVTGRRVVVWAFPPNWARPVTERLAWLTDVLTAEDGTEQRLRLRAVPRRGFEYELLAHARDAVRLDALLMAWQARLFALPIWTDGQRLGADLPQGALSIPVDTVTRDYAAGGLAVLWAGPRATESVEILEVAAGSLTLVRPTLAAWPAGTQIYPARQARMRTQQPVDRHTDNLITAVVQFDLDDASVVTPVPGATTLAGYDVLVEGPNWTEPVRQEYQRAVREIDYLTGVRAVDDPSDQPIWLREQRWLLRDRADIAAFRGWLYAREGRRAPFWAATWGSELVLTAAVADNQQTLTIEAIGYPLYLQGKTGRGAFALQLRDGTWLFRRITGSADGPGAEEETLSFDGALGVAVQPGDVARFMLLALVRLEADAAEIAWETDAVARSTLMLRAVPA